MALLSLAVVCPEGSEECVRPCCGVLARPLGSKGSALLLRVVWF